MAEFKIYRLMNESLVGINLFTNLHEEFKHKKINYKYGDKK